VAPLEEQVSEGLGAPDPARITTLQNLASAFDKLRRRAARPGQVRLSVRDIAARTGRASSTLDPYLRGRRLCPADVYEEILRALGVENRHLRPWLDAWERVAEDPARASGGEPIGGLTRAASPVRRPQPLSRTEEFRYEFVHQARHPAHFGIVTGDVRRVRCADVWVNSENTNMMMARFEEYSVSAIIRFEGAQRDEAGHVVGDVVAEELARKVAGRTPVAPGTAIVTGSGGLARSNGVRHVIHVAAVHGEPGEGYRQVLDVGRCVINALVELDRLGSSDAPVRSILFPLLGTGVGGAELEPTVTAMLDAALDHVAAGQTRDMQTIYFLAYTDAELDVCRGVFDGSPRLARMAAG
jgi:O-acetyl-ADP-ribose deacetylase (regulator of RNase III)